MEKCYFDTEVEDDEMYFDTEVEDDEIETFSTKYENLNTGEICLPTTMTVLLCNRACPYLYILCVVISLRQIQNGESNH